MNESYNLIENNIYYIPTKSILIKLKDSVKEEDKHVIVEKISQQFNSNEIRPLPKINEIKFLSNYLAIYPTSNCNLRCKYCFYESGEENINEIKKWQVDTILRKLVQNSVLLSRYEGKKQMTLLLAGGGEPTYNKDLFKYIVEKYKGLACRYGIEKFTSLITNGIFDNELADYILDNIDSVQFSYDGLPAIQNENRPTKNGLKSNDIVEKNIKYFDNKKFNFSIKITVWPKDFDMIPEMVDYCFSKYINLPIIKIEPVSNEGRAKEKDFLAERDIENYIYYIQEAWKLIYEKKYKGKVLTHYLQSPNDKQYYCSSSVGLNFFLNENGWLMPCSEKLPLKEYAIGFVKEDGIKYVKTDQKYFMPHEELIEYCKKCFAFYNCRGGCPKVTKKNGSEILTIEGKMACKLTKRFVENALKEFLNSKYYCGYKAEDCTISKDLENCVERILKVF